MASIRFALTLHCLLGCLVHFSADAAAIEPETQVWPNSDEGFQQFTRHIRENHYGNLLARRVVQMHVDGGASGQNLLTDGESGERCGDGRVTIDGGPTTVTFYLGEPKPLRDIRVYTFNGDSRANQDFEVRWANASGQPGQMPSFSELPQLTTGDTILGANGGGFLTRFAASDDGTLVDGLADWVQFRIWRTYPTRAGDPGKQNTRAEGWSALIELQVLGDRQDIVMPSPEVLARRETLRKRSKQPPYEKLASWQQTMQAAREAIVTWETDLDVILSGDPEAIDAELGPWRVLGPLPADAPIVRDWDRIRQISWDEPLVSDGTTPMNWKSVDGLADGRMIDLGSQLHASPGQVVLLARDVEILPGHDSRNPLTFSLGLGGGQARLAPTSTKIASSGGPAFPNEVLWEIGNGTGHYQIVVRLPVQQDGSCRFWCSPQASNVNPGAGMQSHRVSRRDALFARIRQDFQDAVSQKQMDWEQADSIWTKIRKYAMAGRERLITDWDPENPTVLAIQYNTFADARLSQLEAELQSLESVIAQRVQSWCEHCPDPSPTADLESARRRYYAVATVQEAVGLHHEILSMRLAVQDQQIDYPARYPRGDPFLAKIDALEQAIEKVWPEVLGGNGADAVLASLLEVRQASEAAEQEILLANPVLDFEKLLLVAGGPGFASNWGGPCSLGSSIVTLSPPRPDGEIQEIYRLPSGRVSNVDVSYDGAKLLFSDAKHIWEVGSDGTAPRQISQQTDEHVHHYDPCYLPDGRIAFVSTACEQAVPCTGGWYVGNLHAMNTDGSNERRLTYDQDHDWNPTVLNSGRLLYTRWEYTDLPHYFTRLLFHMNPDGTGQMEFYGSGSYWPNAMYWSRPIPGHPTEVVCVVSGHHGVSRVGELILLDPAQGRREADGVVQRIPGRGQRVEPVIQDGLVMDTWPRFAMPYPLADPGTNLGGGKYFLVNIQPTAWQPWGLYLVDVYDNITPILIGGYSQPYPLRARPKPPVVPSRIDPSRKDALVYLADIYEGDGLKGVPRGSIQSLRVGSHHYRYGGNGDTSASSIEGGWDVKKILGTVPVNPDGSALFRVPANTPIFVQPLDRDGKAQQVMRSWFCAMPGEVISCVGCHERQNRSVPSKYTAAAFHRRPDEIRPWYGPPRGFSFDREVQPVLDRRCVGCHGGQSHEAGDGLVTTIDLRAKRLHPEYTGSYSPAYIQLQRFVRRAGFESDYHMQVPAEFDADTSPLVRLLKKGHYHVQLDGEEWDRLYTWIDFNVPYPANWRESHRPPDDEQVVRRAKYKQLYAQVDDRDEDALPLPPIAAFEPPQPLQDSSIVTPTLQDWPLTAQQAVALQKAAGDTSLELDLGDGVSMPLTLIPAGRFVMGTADGFPDESPPSVVSIDRSFYLGSFEVTNRQYAQYDPQHDSAYVEGRGKDRINRGMPINDPDLPAVRVTWDQAVAFCRWLSAQTGRDVTLPTEAQWEWACRAGTSTTFSVGDTSQGMAAFANAADGSIARWNHDWYEPNYQDGVPFTGPGGRYAPNAWGLYDMHGNVAEWCQSLYRPYPYQAGDGRNAVQTAGGRVIRGGSWIDTLRYAASASRWRYQPHQSAYSVGFRVAVAASEATSSQLLSNAP